MRLDKIGDRFVWRDDLRPGGTKAAVLSRFIGRGESVAYAGPCEGYAQLALALAARDAGGTAHLFCAERKVRHDITGRAVAAGAIVHELRPGYLSVVRAGARKWCAEHGVKLFPFGLDFAEFEDALVGYAAGLGIAPPQVWCAAGSGLLARALGRAFPAAEIFAVAVGREPSCGRAQVIKSGLSFSQKAKFPPPFPSCENYDAKVWEFFDARAKPDALFWNVAA